MTARALQMDPLSSQHAEQQQEDESSNHSKEVPKQPPDGWTRCHAYVERKRRFCRQRVTTDAPENLDSPRYCGNHSHLYHIPPKRKRVPCPIDGSHTIYEDAVTKHVKICPRVKRLRSQEQELFYRHNINTGGSGDIIDASDNDQVSTEWAKRLALRILQAYQRVFGQQSSATGQSLTFEQIQSAIPLMDLSKPEFESGLAESVKYHRIKSGGHRHLIQQASLIGHLRRIGVLPGLDSKKGTTRRNRKTCLLEMGAGRGMLGLMAAGAAASSQGSPDDLHLVLVERAGTRFKADSVLRMAKGPAADESLNYFRLRHLPWTRIQCDLAHVHMSTVLADLQLCMETQTASDSCSQEAASTRDQHNPRLVVIAKHLCGAGTDIALRSLRDVAPQLDACIMATCCHGICTWDEYVGRDHLRRLIQADDDEISFGKTEFEMMRRWTSGSVAVNCSCSRNGEKETDSQQSPEGDDDSDVEHSLCKAEDSKDSYSASFIVQASGMSCGVQGLGRACQRLLDYGRCEYLRMTLFGEDHSVVELCHYVPVDVTPQNAVLIAYKKPADDA